MGKDHFERLPQKRLDWNSFTVKLPKSVIGLVGNENDYTVIDTVDIRIPKLEKNHNLLRQSLKVFKDNDCFAIYEDNENYYLCFDNSNMTNCFTFKEIINEMLEMENMLKAMLKEIHLVDYKMTFSLEAYNHDF